MQESRDSAIGEQRKEPAFPAGLSWLIRLALLIAVLAPCLLVSAVVLVLLAHLTR